MAFKEAIEQHYNNVKTMQSQTDNMVRCMAMSVKEELKRNAADKVKMWDEETKRKISEIQSSYNKIWSEK